MLYREVKYLYSPSLDFYFHEALSQSVGYIVCLRNNLKKVSQVPGIQFYGCMAVEGSNQCIEAIFHRLSASQIVLD